MCLLSAIWSTNIACTTRCKRQQPQHDASVQVTAIKVGRLLTNHKRQLLHYNVESLKNQLASYPKLRPILGPTFGLNGWRQVAGATGLRGA